MVGFSVLDERSLVMISGYKCISHRPVSCREADASRSPNSKCSPDAMPNRDVTILYRGPLSSCNYDCCYCPFAKRHEDAEQLLTDRLALEKFVNWCLQYSGGSLSVFFTPWGEALTRKWYHVAIQQLSHLPFVRRVAVQTNLSWNLDWLSQCQRERLGFWCTYHPSQIRRDDFLEQCRVLRSHGVAHSVGMVARPEDYDEIEAMRATLPVDTYLWLNAWDIQDGQKYQYSEEERRRLTNVDPHFPVNTLDHPSKGFPCRTGADVFSVDGHGEVRRCHFVKARIGNLYDPDWTFPDVSLPCPASTCGCHIGYIHLPHLKQADIYGDGLLERIPV
jgi:hypothetical protein